MTIQHTDVLLIAKNSNRLYSVQKQVQNGFEKKDIILVKYTKFIKRNFENIVISIPVIQKEIFIVRFRNSEKVHLVQK